MRIRDVLWNGNTFYATRRATIEEIEEVLLNYRSSFRRNLPGRAATHIAKGRTKAGRPLTVAFRYRRADQSARPINAWDD